MVFIVEILLILGLVVYAILNVPPSSNPVLLSPDNSLYKEQQPKPVRLKIPKISVDALIEHKGITSNGEMDVPKNPSNTAWFSLGTRPGDEGSAVIGGHFGWRDNIPAVFDNLDKLQKGDVVLVEDEKGSNITFVVRESRIYNPKEYTPDIFVSNDDKAHLNLITCTGDWNKANKSYSTRLVVFTDKE